MSLDYWHRGSRILFGHGVAATVGHQVPADGRHIGVIASSSAARLGHLDTVLSGLPPGDVPVVVGARPHGEGDEVGSALDALQGCSVVVAVGGGSPLGVAKAVADAQGAAVVAVPTTYSGSEMTAVYGVTVDGHKIVRRDRRYARPVLVAYDPLLTQHLPDRVRIGSVSNVLAHVLDIDHAVVPPPTVAVAARAVFLVSRALAGGVDPARREEDLMLAGHLGGVVLDEAGYGLGHALCHAVGGATGAQHGDVHAIVLRGMVARWLRSEDPLMREMLDNVSPDGDARVQLDCWLDGAGLPTRLRDVGVEGGALEVLARRACDEISVADSGPAERVLRSVW